MDVFLRPFRHILIVAALALTASLPIFGFAHSGLPICADELVLKPELFTRFEPPNTNQIDVIRNYLGHKNADYQHAFWFANEFGERLANAVFASYRKNETMNVVIAMGGAEPMGILLRQIARKRGLTNVHFIEAYLTTKILRPWQGSVRSGRFSFHKRRTGIGEAPQEVCLVGERQSGSNCDQEVLEYMNQLGIYKGAQQIVVVDTGFSGTVAEAVNYGAEKLNSSATISAVLLAYNGEKIMSNTLSIRGLNDESLRHCDMHSACWWAYMLDEGHAQYDPRGGTFGFAFRRSSNSPSALIRDQNGDWQPDIVALDTPEEILKHQAVALGFWDAIHQIRPAREVPKRRTDK